MLTDKLRLISLTIVTAFCLTVPSHLTARGDEPSSPESAASKPANSQPASQPVAASRPADRSTPAITIDRFLALYQQAQTDPTKNSELMPYFDFSELPESQDSERLTLTLRLGEYLVKKQIVTQQKYVELREVTDANEIVIHEEKINEDTTASIRLVTGADGLWLFDPQTVANIPLLYASTVPAPSTQPVAIPDDVPVEFSSPQATMRTFVDAATAEKPDLAKAAACLNLTPFGAQAGDTQATAFAYKLKLVLFSAGEVTPTELPNSPDTESPYTHKAFAGGNITLERMSDGRWLFAETTLKQLEAMSEAVERDSTAESGVSFWELPDLWLSSRLPKSLNDKYLDIKLWKWCGILIILLVGLLLDRILKYILRGIVRITLSRRLDREEAKANRDSLRALATLALGGFWMAGFGLLAIGNQSMALWLNSISQLVLVCAGIWFTYGIIDLIAGFVHTHARKTASKLDDIVIPLVRKSAKVAATVLGVALFAKRLFPEDYEKLLAGLGLGGLAFALAAQDTIKNFFGSITVLLDRPFEIGDSIVIGSVAGTVEEIGFRSTRIRTFENSLVSVPNGHLIDAITDNVGRRQYRRLKATLGLTYDTTPEKIEAFCEGVRELIRRHPHTRKDSYQVYFHEFGDFSLNVLLYCFHDVPDWSTELRERHNLLLDILRLAEQLGVSFAFPTQTIQFERIDSASQPPSQDNGSHRLAADLLGRSEAAIAIKQAGQRETKPVVIAMQPQQIDEGYVESRSNSDGKRGRDVDKYE